MNSQSLSLSLGVINQVIIRACESLLPHDLPDFQVEISIPICPMELEALLSLKDYLEFELAGLCAELPSGIYIHTSEL
jgi:hypothetical protein